MATAPGSHARRYREIVQVLVRHGLGHAVHAAGFAHWIPREVPQPAGPAAEVPGPVHLRLALEELGPAFIKMGQILSTRPDLVPEAIRAELALLQDAAAPVPAEAIRAVVREELGMDPGAAFSAFDDEPLASASIGQVHRARLADGTAVVVKVRKPGAVERIREDLEILRTAAARASRTWGVLAEYNVPGLVEEFARTLTAELDYLEEARNAERFAHNFAGDARFRFPRVFWETTTSRVLTLELMQGLKIDDLEGLDAAGVDRRALADHAAGALAQMVFEDGFFQADPHPGNMFVEPTGRIALIDFGMVGTLDESLRRGLGRILVAIAGKDPRRLARALEALSVSGPVADRAQLAADVAGFLELYDRLELQDVELGSLAQRLLGIVREHRLRLPAQVAVIVKMLVMAEGLGRRLDPTFQLSRILGPYVARMLLELYSPAAFARSAKAAGITALDAAADLPGMLERASEILASGGIEVRLRAAELEPLLARAERVGNRLVVAVVAAALLRGVGGIVSADRRWEDWRAPLVRTGLAALGGLGGYLAATTLHRRRPGRGGLHRT